MVAPSKPPGVDLGELGSSGLLRMAGYVHEELVRDLQGYRWNKIVREMADNDDVIGAMLFAIEMLCRQVTWDVVPASSSTEDKEAAEFVQGVLFDDMSQSFQETLSEILTMLQWGFEWSEIIWKYRQGDQRDPSKRSKFSDGKVGIRKLAPRAQETLHRWEFDTDGGIQAFIQWAPPEYKQVSIPITKSLLFRTTTRKGNPEGRSILRSAWLPWYYKRNIQRIEAIGVERDLAGLPVALVPPEYFSSTAPPEMRAVYDKVKEIVVGIRRDEQEGIVFPNIFDEKGNKLFELTLLSTGGTRQFDTNTIIQRYDQRIAMCVLADFLLLGQKATGSYALAESKTELFSVAIGTWLESIAQVINRHLIPRLLQLNGYNLKAPPVLKHGDIETVELASLGEYISKLSGVGLQAVFTPQVVGYLMEQAHLPVPENLEDIMKQADEEKKAQAAAISGQQPQMGPDGKPIIPNNINGKVGAASGIVGADASVMKEFVASEERLQLLLALAEN